MSTLEPSGDLPDFSDADIEAQFAGMMADVTIDATAADLTPEADTLPDDGIVFKRDGDTVQVMLPAEYREFIGVQVDDLMSVLETDHPAAKRLAPSVSDDADIDAAFADTAGAQLTAERLLSLSLVKATLFESEISLPEADAWLRCVNDLRVAVTAAFDVKTDEDMEVLHEDATVSGLLSLLGLLTVQLLDVLG